MQPHRSNETVYYRCKYRDEVGDSGIERTGHPKNVFIREDKLIDEVDAWFCKRVFGSERLDLVEIEFEQNLRETEEERKETLAAIQARLNKVKKKIEGYKELQDAGADVKTIVT